MIVMSNLIDDYVISHDFKYNASFYELKLEKNMWIWKKKNEYTCSTN